MFTRQLSISNRIRHVTKNQTKNHDSRKDERLVMHSDFLAILFFYKDCYNAIMDCYSQSVTVVKLKKDLSWNAQFTAKGLEESVRHVECSASFCPFFHISVTVQKLTQDRTIRAFIPAILLNLSLPLLTQHFCYVILKSLLIRHVNDYSNTR